ncbi:MAG: hypothetical protein JO236_03735 [Mycobacterium sp.]|uniref:hypothetical protein n=1 Tax=Mycobacterium sp. TaxID=1785 RepID=UPI001EBB0EB7|nr:hypothetical protein [Mycobacterium sp.]MBW0016645.1 hypothetical protein [Mycobacterium sp.]
MSTRTSANGGFAGVVGVLLIVAIIIRFIWWLLGVAALIGLYIAVRALVRQYRRREAAYARYREALAARADQQHNWVLRGDTRGIYGVEGAELMRYLYPAHDRVKRRTRPGYDRR